MADNLSNGKPFVDPDSAPLSSGKPFVDPDDVRSAPGEIVTGLKRGLYQGVQGLGGALQAPAEQSGMEPGIVSSAGKALEDFGKAGAGRNVAQTDQHGPVTNFLSQVAEAPGAALPAIGAFTGATLAASETGPIAPFIGGAAGAGEAGEQAWHERYQQALQTMSPDDARDYANSSAVVAAAAMGALPVVGKGLGVAARLAVPLKDAGEAAASVVGKQFLPELAKSAAEMTGANVVTGAAGAAGQAAVDQGAGVDTPTPLNAALASIPGSVAASVGFAPFSFLHASGSVKAAQAKAAILADPKANRDPVVKEVYEAMHKVDPDGANMWAINAAEAKTAGVPIGTDASWTSGLHPTAWPKLPPPPPPGGGGTPSAAAQAADSAAVARQAARDAEQARLAASGPLGRAAAVGMDSGIVDQKAAERAAEIPAAEPSQPLTAAGPADEQAQQNITSVARGQPPQPLADAQRVAASAHPDEPMTVVPHPSGSGFTVVPDRLITPNISEQVAGLQRGGELPAPPSVMLGREGLEGAGTQPQTAADRAQASPFPFPTPEAARARADALTMRTGVEHEVVPHPARSDAFAVRPVEEGADHAVQEPEGGEVLQREPGEAGVAGGERERVEPSLEGQEVAEERPQAAGEEGDHEAGLHEDVGKLLAEPTRESADKFDSKAIEPDSDEHYGLTRLFKEAGRTPDEFAGTPFTTFDWTDKTDTLPARFYPDGSIGIRADVLRAVSRGHGITDRAAEWLNHEEGHSMDSAGNGTFHSSTAPSFEMSGEGADRTPVGGIIKEAFDAYSNPDSQLGAELKYPFDMMEDRAADHNMSSEAKLTETVKNETFAQLAMIYRANPELMKEELPKAYSLFQRIKNGQRGNGVAAARRSVFEALRAAGADGRVDERPAGEANAADQGGAGLRHARGGVGKSLDEHNGPATERNAAKPEDFTSGKVKDILKKKNWAILTAENPGGKTVSDERNATQNSKLVADMKRLGLKYTPVIGRYGAPKDEHSFVVTGVAPEVAHRLGKKYGQDSILTRKGLEYQDGSITPAIDVTEHATAPEDYYTRMPDGTMFTVNPDWDAPRIPKVLPDSINKLLTPDEQKLVTVGRDRVARMLDIFNDMPDTKFFMAAAKAGEAAKEWYTSSFNAIKDVYGPDYRRFLSLMAALSPQTNVRGNFYNAARVFAAWEKAGRPTDGRLAKIFNDNLVTDLGREDGKKAMTAWTMNGTRALTAEDPMDIKLSGPKVSSFMQNLLGNGAEVTNDRHMADFAGIKQSLLGGAKLKGQELAGKGPGYLALSAKVRQAAAKLGWAPGDTQAAIWSWWNSLKKLMKETGRSAVDLINDGSLTRERIAAEPHLGSYLHEREFGNIDPARAERAGRVAGGQGGEVGASKPVNGRPARPSRADIDNAKRLDALKQRRADRGEADESDLTDLGVNDEDSDGIRFARVKGDDRTGNLDLDTSTDRFRKWFGDSKTVDARGRPLKLYHGTFNDFTKFAPEEGEAQSYFGRGIYMSDSVHDVNSNYATFSGPDQIYKLNERAEQMMSDRESGAVTLQDAADSFDSQGAIMPLYAKIENPAIFGGPDQTRLSYHLITDADGEIKGEDGSLLPFLDALERHANASDTAGFNTAAMEKALDNGSISLDELLYMMRDSDLMGADDEGNEVWGGPLLSMALQDLGYDGVIDHRIHERFGMQNTKNVTHYVAFDARQVKSAIGNRGTYSSSDPDIRYARATKPFFSALERGMDKAPFAKNGSVATKILSNWIESRIKDGLFKRDEVEWTGLKDYLNLIGEKVTRNEVMNYLDHAGVGVESTVLGGGMNRAKLLGLTKELETAIRFAAPDVKMSQIDEHLEELEARSLDARDLVDMYGQGVREPAEELEQFIKMGAPQTQYASYVEPGGQNYRELLLKLPRQADTQAMVAQYDALKARRASTTDQTEIDRLNKAMNDLADREARSPNQHFIAPHFSAHAKDILAHVRYDDHVDPTGKKVLFLQELQSDWAQAGRKHGFGDDSASKAAAARLEEVGNELEELQVLREAASTEVSNIAQRVRLEMGVPRAYADLPINERKEWNDRFIAARDNDPEYKAAYEKYNALHEKTVATSDLLYDLNAAANGESRTPVAPFVTKTEAWTALALKRMIAHAALEGYDRIAWTTGQQQADRYSLERHVAKIDWKESGGKDGKQVNILHHSGRVDYVIIDRGGKVVDASTYHLEGHNIGEVVGDEIAEKVMSDDTGNLEGLDLRVGGKGMRTYYDQIVPNVANDVLKKLGGDRVIPVEMSTSTETPAFVLNVGRSGIWRVFAETRNGDDHVGDFETEEAARAAAKAYDAKWGGAQNQLGFDITPAMKAKIANEGGVPLFARDDGRRVSLKSLMSKITGGKAADAEQQFTKDGQPVRDDERGAQPIDKDKPDWVAAKDANTQEFLRKAGVWVTGKTWRERWNDLRRDFGLKIIQWAFDQYRPVLDRVSKYSYQLLRMASSSDNGLAALVHNGQVELNDYGALKVRAGTKGLRDIMSTLGGEHDRFLAWIAANRAERLAKEGREHNFTAEEIAAGKKLNTQTADDPFKGEGTRAMAYARALKDFHALNKSVLDIAEKAGIVDPEARKLYEDEFYVNFRRAEKGEPEFDAANLSGMVNAKGIKRLKGGADELHDLMANTMNNWSGLLSSAMRNNAAWHTLQEAEGIKDADGVPMAERVNPNKTDQKTVYVLQDGKQVHYVVNDPFVSQAISSLGPNTMRGPVMKALGAMKHALTVGTTWSPIFRLRHTIREQITALAANPTGYNPVKNWIDGFKYSSRNNPEYANMAAGGAFFNLGLDLEGNRAAYVKRLIEHEIDPKSLVDSPHKAVQMLGHLADWWKETGERSDSITRANLYRQTYARMIADGVDPERAHFEASYVARDAMDYSLHGTLPAIRMLTQVVPFMNARLQGLYKLGRGAHENPKRFAAVVGGITLATIALALAQRKDRAVQTASDWDKDNNWLVHAGNVMYRIPKPFEVGAMATVAERALEVAMNGFQPADREKFATRLWTIVGSQLNLNPIPQAVFPALELWANKDTFTGMQIEPGRDEKLTAGMHVGPNTSAFAQDLSHGMGAVLPDKLTMSPQQIDFAVNAWLGWVGSHAVATADLALRPLSGLPAKPTPRLDDYFLIGDFAHQTPSNNSQFLSDYYDHMIDVQKAFGDMRELQKTGQTKQAVEYMKEHGNIVGLEHTYIATQRAIGHLNQRARYVNMSNMDPDAKRAELDRIAQVKNSLSEAAEAARTRAVNNPRPATQGR